MANRVTETEVKEIIAVNTSVTSIAAFIIAANLIVTEKLANSSLGAARLKEIERWLSAHFIAIRDPRVKRKKIDNAEKEYHGDVGTLEGIKSTFYGQTALVLDSTGTLASLGKRAAKIQAIPMSD